jgi:anti-sigma regulatory factor (Ser/Thr protein kinase)
VTIADTGKGFAVNGAGQMAGAFSEGGRGLALMQMLMDEADFHVEEGRGTQVQLTKRVVFEDSSLLRDSE